MHSFDKPAICPISCGFFTEQMCHRHESKSRVYHEKHSSINVPIMSPLFCPCNPTTLILWTNTFLCPAQLSSQDHHQCCQPYLGNFWVGLGLFIGFDWLSLFIHPFLISCSILFCYKCLVHPMKYTGKISLPGMLWQMKKGQQRRRNTNICFLQLHSFGVKLGTV